MGISEEVKFTYLIVTKRINTRIFFNKVNFLLNRLQLTNSNKSIGVKNNFLFLEKSGAWNLCGWYHYFAGVLRFLYRKNIVFVFFFIFSWIIQFIIILLRTGTTNSSRRNGFTNWFQCYPRYDGPSTRSFTTAYIPVHVFLRKFLVNLYCVRLTEIFSTFFFFFFSFIFQFNWSGTVKVPALCQYAHKLAFLASQSMQGMPNSKLDNTLYYL